MKIVIVGPATPYRGGIAKFNDVLAQNFLRTGHDVQIVNFTMQYPSFLFPGKTQYTDAPAPKGIRITRLVNSVNPISWCRAARFICEQKPDIVIFRYWMPFMAPALGTIARKVAKAGIRTVALTDNIVPHEKHFYDHPATAYFLRPMKSVVYMSDQVGRDLDAFNFSGNRQMAPHPLYDTYGEGVTRTEACTVLGLDPAVRYVMFFGFIREYKGLDLLLKAWKMLPNRENKRLLVAGEFYSNRDQYVQLIDNLGIADEIILRDDYIPEEQVCYYFSVADLLVQPYKSATQSGITQIAYNFGLPMVVTNVGGLAEIVPDGKVGYITEVNENAIRDAIQDFFDNNREAEFRANMHLEKERFSWENMMSALLK